MKGLAEFVLSLCDLAEAEGRVFRENVFRVGIGCILAALGLLFIGASLAFIAASFYHALLTITSTPMALLAISAFCAFIGFILLWLGCFNKSGKRQIRNAKHEKS